MLVLQDSDVQSFPFVKLKYITVQVCKRSASIRLIKSMIRSLFHLIILVSHNPLLRHFYSYLDYILITWKEITYNFPVLRFVFDVFAMDSEAVRVSVHIYPWFPIPQTAILVRYSFWASSSICILRMSFASVGVPAVMTLLLSVLVLLLFPGFART